MPNALWLADVLRAGGLKVAEQPGWQTRGRATLGTVKGCLAHHTAGPKGGNMPSLGVVTNGRSDLPGPLCNLGLGRDGTWYVVASGKANHAGKGSWHGVTNGNSELIGIEAENNGVDEPWPEIQLDAYARGCAAILKHIGADPIMCAGHREYALPKGRKTDPDFDMDAFRLRVAGVMNGGIVRPPIPAKDASGEFTLRRGDKGDAVKAMQIAIGIKPADAAFGPKTEAAVRSWQRAHGLAVADGIWGPASRIALTMKAAA